MKILQLLPSLDPRQGGPAECVRQSAVALAAQGHRVEVLTLDAPDAPWLRDAGLPVHALGPVRGGYRYCPALLPWLREHAQGFDAVIVNGLWQHHGFAAWQALRDSGVPYFVFPHGMLDPWFRRAYPLKHLKKWLYWPWAEYRVLRDARAVLFTAEEERRRARESFWLYRANERVVSFGTSAPPPAHAADGGSLAERFLAAHPALRGKRLVLFLGRIHPKKGCDLLIEAFAREAAQVPAAHLVIAGPDSAGWGSALRELAAARGIADRISWPGMLRDEMKWGAFRASEVFALPSHQENFGIAVAEALGCGLPGLLSTEVNIWREVVQGGAGMGAADTVDGTAGMLRGWFALTPAERARMRARAQAVFAQHFTMEAMAVDLLRVVQEGAAHAAGAQGSGMPRPAGLARSLLAQGVEEKR
ncbi:glycosyltransferase (plasmid) [Cupriavidus necator]|uniref:Glycosyltransferase n=1 Tax=Cupriavidus necator TaxID=106590 RepID=A0A367P8N3_CUPNE|nr:glycosyltransferase [Cupriavidus necator]QQX89586.1 glycosyltransferase [Cupriavidus necator]RCJ03863.1 glycosyltransferase [Cupriavidus necator]